jgi:PAS domain-containing protein
VVRLIIEGAMFPPSAVAEEILRVTARALRMRDTALLAAIDDLPVSVYAIDLKGFLTYYNPHCVFFAGRKPLLGRDRWCVSWKLYTEDGARLPHDQCPMAVVLQENAPIRGVRAVIERPNGSRTTFMPLPTPFYHDDGRLLGAVNMLVDLTEDLQAVFDGLCDEGLRRWHQCVIDRALGSLSLDDVKALVTEIETEIERQTPPVLN